MLRQRHARALHRLRALRADLRRARAHGSDQRVRRLTEQVRAARQRSYRLRIEALRACDRTPPDTRVVAGPPQGAVVQGRQARFQVRSRARDLAGYECSDNGRSWSWCGSRDGRVGNDFDAAFGAHTLRVRAVDRAGNVDRTPVARRFTLRYYASLEAGGDRTCGVRPNGVVTCWGKAFPGSVQATVDAAVAVTLGPGDHACATRRVDTGVVCWGADDAGQASPPLGTTGRVFVGRDHTCTQYICWGDGSDGELATPADITTIVGAGNDFTCGNGATPRCWGDGADGRTTVPAGVDTIYAVGPDRACGWADVRLVCWGKPFPAADPGLDRDTAPRLDLGGDHGCFESVYGAACWGDNSFGQLRPPASVRYLIAGSTVVGAHHTCGLDPDGVAACFGDDRAGQSSPRPA